jgi:hypothetical protein
MTKSRNILAPRHRWTDDQVEHLRQHYASTLTVDLAATLGVRASRILAKANALGLYKTTALISETARQRTMAPGHGSLASRIKPGTVPWNKGIQGERVSPDTEFKPGNRPHTWVPVGSHRINADGYLDRKVTDDGGPSQRWQPVHRLVWIDAHGPVPAGHIVTFKPGRRTTDLVQITLDAIELVTRAENMRRNSYHTNYPPELRSLVQLRGALQRQINRTAKEAETT